MQPTVDVGEVRAELIYLYTYVPIYPYTCIPIYLYAYIPIYLYTYVPIYLYMFGLRRLCLLLLVSLLVLM